MISDKRGQQLHNKASRGEMLTKEEEHFLEEWYLLQDRAETASLGITEEEISPSGLQAQIEAILVELVNITKRIREISLENDTLRNENIVLRNQLTKLFGQKSA